MPPPAAPSAGGRCAAAGLAPALLLALSLAAAALPRASAHGWLSVPESRNSRVNNDQSTPYGIAYNRMSGNGRGFEALDTTGPKPHLPGICGDPFQDINDSSASTYFQDHPMSPNVQYTAGQTIHLEWRMHVNHGGYFAFRLCPLNPRAGQQITQACFDRYLLQRADGLGTRTYILTKTYAATLSMDYVLPANVTCPDGCVLQWEYQTLNSCWMPCENAAQCTGAVGTYTTQGTNPAQGQRLLPVCSTPLTGPIRTERFLNCADVRILAAGASPSPSPSPSPPASPSPPPPASPSPSPPPSGTCSGGTAAPGGACGPSSGNKCCPSGQCCSQWGWCGVTSAHCGAGCQSPFGACTKARAAARLARAAARQGTAQADLALAMYGPAATGAPAPDSSAPAEPAGQAPPPAASPSP